MADEVNITAVGGKANPPPWATEETLRRLTDLTQAGVQLDKEAGKDRTKEEKAANKRIRGLGKQVDKSLKEQSKFLHDRLQDVIKGAIVGGASFETIIKKWGQTFGETIASWASKFWPFGLALGIAVVSLKALNEVVQQALSGFQDLFDTGVGLNGSFIDMIGIAGDFNVGLFDIIEGLKTYSTVVSRLSTESNRGSRAFFELHDAVRANIRTQHFYGLSIIDQIEFLGEYLETQKGLGQIQQLNRTRTAAEVSEYISQITKLSHFTGERRKQIQKEVEDVMRQESMQLALSNMSEEMQLEARKFLAINRVYGEAAFQAAQEMIITKGTAGLTELTGAFVAFNPTIHRAQKEMLDTVLSGNNLTEEAQGKFVGIYNKHGKELLKAYGPSLAIIAQQNDTYGKALTGAILARNYTEETYRTNKAFRDSATQFYMSWEDLKRNFLGKFYSLANAFLEILEENGVLNMAFDNLRKWLTDFNNWATWATLQATMEGWVETIKGWMISFGKFMDNFSPTGLMLDFESLGIKLIDELVLRFEFALDKVVNKLTFGLGGTSKSFKDRQIELEKERNEYKSQFPGDTPPPGWMSPDERKKYNSKVPLMAKGGIARVPSVFGEAGPEVAIPLTTGERIPVAEVRRSATEMKTFEDIRSLLEDIKDRVEFQAQEIQTQTGIQRQIERKAGSDSSRIF